MKIMQKVSQWFKDINNASKIRSNISKAFTVKNQLRLINLLLITIGLFLSIWAIGFKYFGEGSELLPAAGAFFLAFVWLFCLRFAIAHSKDARERYVQKTVRALWKLCKIVFWSVVICAALIYFGIVLCTMAQMGYFPKLMEVYPALGPLSSSISLQVNEMLEMLIPFIG